MMLFKMMLFKMMIYLEFARGYVRWLFERIGDREHPIPASVHDVYEGAIAPSPEGTVVLEWLAFSGRGQNVFTPNPGKEKALRERIDLIRQRVNIR